MAHGGEHAVRCITREPTATRACYADVPVKPNTQYRLSGWVKTHAFNGKASLNDHLGAGRDGEDHRPRDRLVGGRDDLQHAATAPSASINLLHVGKGDGYCDDVKLCEVTGDTGEASCSPATRSAASRSSSSIPPPPAFSATRCTARASTVGPPLDGIATRATPAYITESLLEPNKVLAKGYETLGTSPMPPMGLVLKPQELEDVKAFLQTLK